LASVEVFLVPVAADRYELYCEEHDDHPAWEEGDKPKGFVRRAAQAFREQLAEAEREGRRGGPHPDNPPRSFAARLKARSLRWVAESIAEQRLLWQLRGRADAHLVHPDDLTDVQARQLLRRSLQRDWERHRFWLIVDSLAGIASILLVLLPGPNIIGYYFFFRIFGHYLSLRGARHGLNRTVWAPRPSAPLTTLRSVVNDRPEARADVVSAVESSLGLEHLATFFQRTAVS
jgi:hypothetical protein